MAEPTFQPGFRFSTFDGISVVIGITVAVTLGSVAWWIGFLVAFVVAHFFAYCNVFRVARSLELAWSGIFIVLMYGTITLDMLSWSMSIGCSLLATAIVIALEMSKPSYHGILWQRINPRLPTWWAAHSKTTIETVDRTTSKPR